MLAQQTLNRVPGVVDAESVSSTARARGKPSGPPAPFAWQPNGQERRRTWSIVGCPHCGGDLRHHNDQSNNVFSCMECGYGLWVEPSMDVLTWDEFRARARLDELDLAA